MFLDVSIFSVRSLIPFIKLLVHFLVLTHNFEFFIGISKRISSGLYSEIQLLLINPVK